MLRRLGEMPSGKLVLLAKTFCLLVVARVALALVPVKRVIGWRGRALTVPLLDSRETAIRDACWAVLVVARYSPIRFVCFPQCLAASELLRSAGIASRLHYGVRRSDAARLETHTWLEVEGEILIGGDVAAEFSTLEVY